MDKTHEAVSHSNHFIVHVMGPEGVAPNDFWRRERDQFTQGFHATNIMEKALDLNWLWIFPIRSQCCQAVIRGHATFCKESCCALPTQSRVIRDTRPVIKSQRTIGKAQAGLLPFLLTGIMGLRNPRVMWRNCKRSCDAMHRNHWYIKPNITTDQADTMITMSHEIVIGYQDSAKNICID